jgi:predicted metalloprotease with PDZ domain
MTRPSLQDTPAELQFGAFGSRPNSVEKKLATQGDSRMSKFTLRILLFLSAAVALGNVPARAESSQAIRLAVDATQAPQKIIRVHMVIPAAPGPLTLFYPKWIQGVHAPIGPISNLTGLKISANGKLLSWKRDTLDVFTFHVDVPSGAKEVEASFDYLVSGGPVCSATAKLLDLNWYPVLLYPAGAPSSQIIFKPTLQLPAGWKFGTALPVESQSASEIVFQSVALDRLLDSPLIAGEYYHVFDLTPPGEAIHHEIDVVSDSEAALAMSPEVQKGLANVVAESGKLFGSRHYRNYHFLLTLSEHTPHFGVEHHESNDSRLPERVLLSPGAAREVGGLLAHEFAHSWSGKFRRPKDMSTPDFQVPLQTELLWAYEGNTSYLGDLLAARSGLWTADDYHQALASYAASLGPGRPGRTWRPVLDTAVAVPGTFTGGPDSGGWTSWRRGSDYYEEGELLWLEAANVIHDQSHGQKSLEDFFHIFYGGANNGPELKPYTFDELVQMLNQVVKYDWADFWNSRLMSTSPEPPARGIEASGWKLTFTPEPPAPGRTSRGISVGTYTIGLNLSREGVVSDAIFCGPAFKAGLAPGMKIVGVNGRLFTPEILDDAIKASKRNSRPIELLVIVNDYYKICSIDYHDGERYPHLVRIPDRPDYLDDLLKPEAR